MRQDYTKPDVVTMDLKTASAMMIVQTSFEGVWDTGEELDY